MAKIKNHYLEKILQNEKKKSNEIYDRNKFRNLKENIKQEIAIKKQEEQIERQKQKQITSDFYHKIQTLSSFDFEEMLINNRKLIDDIHHKKGIVKKDINISDLLEEEEINNHFYNNIHDIEILWRNKRKLIEK
jgi:hypothetical protein